MHCPLMIEVRECMIIIIIYGKSTTASPIFCVASTVSVNI